MFGTSFAVAAPANAAKRADASGPVGFLRIAAGHRVARRAQPVGPDGYVDGSMT